MKYVSSVAVHATVPGEGRLSYTSDKVSMEVSREEAASLSNVVLGSDTMKIQTPDLGGMDIGNTVDVEV